MVVHALSPSTLGSRDRQISEFEASLVHKMSPRTARAIQRNPASKKQKTKNKKQKTTKKGNFRKHAKENTITNIVFFFTLVTYDIL